LLSGPEEGLIVSKRRKMEGWKDGRKKEKNHRIRNYLTANKDCISFTQGVYGSTYNAEQLGSLYTLCD